MRALILAGFIVLSNLTVLADPPKRDHEKAGATERAKSGAAEMHEVLVKFISNTFDLPASYIKERWKDDVMDGPDSLMGAVRDMKKGDDKRVAKIIAQLIGTLNPKSAETAFEKARDSFIESSTQEPKGVYSDFEERVLFGMYAWPSDKTKAPAFCQKTIDTVTTFEGDKKAPHEKYKNDFDTKLVDATKKDDKALSEDDLKKAVVDPCFGKDGEKFKYDAYGKFWEHFNKAADEVYAKNEDFHKKADEFKAADTKEKKAELAKTITAQWGPEALSTFGGQQTRSGWDAKDTEGKSIVEDRADKAYRIAAWAQNNFEKPSVLKLEGGGQKFDVALVDGEPAGAAVAKQIKDLDAKFTKPEFGPIDFRPAAAQPVVAQTQQQPAQPKFTLDGLAENAALPKHDLSSTSRDATVIKDIADALTAGISDPAKRIAAGTHVAAGKCVSCHSGESGEAGLGFDDKGKVTHFKAKSVGTDATQITAALAAIKKRATSAESAAKPMPPKDSNAELTVFEKAQIAMWAAEKGVK